MKRRTRSGYCTPANQASRAWGFASPDSDYDVRFIYARQADSYLSILDPKNFIEVPVDSVLDINGWDIRKALRLFLASNPPLYEWLQSPVVYQMNPDFLHDLQVLMPGYFSLRAGCHHYLSMTRKMLETHLCTERVKIKKYFYALRTALAALWIVRKEALPPMQLQDLRGLVTEAGWQQEVDNLLQIKKRSDEKTGTEAVAMLHQWLGAVVDEVSAKAPALPVPEPDAEGLNRIFKKWIYHHDV